MSLFFQSAVIGLCTALLPALAQATTTSYTEQSPKRAADFVDQLGAVTHLENKAGPYADGQTILDLLKYIGVHHVRAAVPTPGTIDKYRMLGKNGIRFNFLIIGPPEPLIPIIEELAPYTDSVEGPNEVNALPVTYKGLHGTDAAIAEQKTIYELVKGSHILNGSGKSTPVLGFSLTTGANSKIYGDLSAFADYGNVHGYMSLGFPPFYGMPFAVRPTYYVPGKPVVLTETNYNSLTLNEDVQARYVLDWIFDNAMHNYALRIYLYQLSDGWKMHGPSDVEANWGLFKLDNSPKEIATALHNLSLIFKDTDPAAASFTPRPISYALQGSLPWTIGQNISDWHTVIQKRDGTNDLILWSEPFIWKGAPVTSVKANIVTVTFDRPYRSVRIFDPLQSAEPIGSYSAVSSVSVSVTDHPIVVEARDGRQ